MGQRRPGRQPQLLPLRNNGHLRVEHGNGQSVEQLYSEEPVFEAAGNSRSGVRVPAVHGVPQWRLVTVGRMSLPIVSTEMTGRRMGLVLGAGHFEGEIDEVRVYNRALTEREVVAHAGLPPTVAKPVFSRFCPRCTTRSSGWR